jgi:hypothetical protein
VPAGICAHFVNWGAVEIILNWPHFPDGDGEARLVMALIDPTESPQVHEKRVVLIRNQSTERSRQPPILSLVSLYHIDYFPNPAPFPCFYGTTKFFISKLVVHTKNCLEIVSQVASPTSRLAATLPYRLRCTRN